MAWGYIREFIQTQKKNTQSEKDNVARKLTEAPLTDSAGEAGELSPETVAAIALALHLNDADQAVELMPETVAAIALALHMHIFSIQPASSAMTEIVSDAWTQSGRIMTMTDRLSVFGRKPN